MCDLRLYFQITSAHPGTGQYPGALVHGCRAEDFAALTSPRFAAFGQRECSRSILLVPSRPLRFFNWIEQNPSVLRQKPQQSAGGFSSKSMCMAICSTIWAGTLILSEAVGQKVHRPSS